MTHEQSSAFYSSFQNDQGTTTTMHQNWQKSIKEVDEKIVSMHQKITSASRETVKNLYEKNLRILQDQKAQLEIDPSSIETIRCTPKLKSTDNKSETRPEEWYGMVNGEEKQLLGSYVHQHFHEHLVHNARRHAYEGDDEAVTIDLNSLSAASAEVGA